MEEESQVSPLAPAQFYRRSDEEFAVAAKPNNPRQKRSSKCFVYILAMVVLLSIAALVFSLTVLRVESPEVKLTSVAVKKLTYFTAPLTSVNVTMVAEISVHNKNFGRFMFENSSAAVLYQSVKIGGAKIKPGVARARRTERLNITMEVRSNGLLMENQNFSSNVNSGLLKLRSYAKLIGRVRVKILKKKIIDREQRIEMNCTMSLNLTSKAIQDLRCM